ncbi:hypothetical protein [Streptomyces sp. NPDC096339]|uniref:hypothetical protein n=1 Tax=Streptomyces sp. NPDC096339 TaxID=3366086 RepID=UPI003827FAB8
MARPLTDVCRTGGAGLAVVDGLAASATASIATTAAATRPTRLAGRFDVVTDVLVAVTYVSVAFGSGVGQGLEHHDDDGEEREE